MIKPFTKAIRNFAAFISDHNIPPVELFVVPSYYTIEPGNENFGFAEYVPSEKRIIVAGGVDTDVKSYVFTSLAHEYYRHIQYMQGRDFDEAEAEKYAKRKFEQFYRQKGDKK